MNKKRYLVLVSRFLSIFIITTIMLSPVGVFAQSTEGESPWEGRDREEVRQWRERSSLISSRIQSLSTTRVQDLPVPILFGITPDNISSNFGDPRSGGRLHEGLDIMTPNRALIVTPTDAVVIRTGTGSSAGHYVYTANPGGETFAYMHLDEIAKINEGDFLQKGQLIGYVGNTGNAIGGAPHLHFEIQNNNVATDPFPRLTRIFPVADKIEYLKNILNSSTDQQALAENIVTLYRKELVQAQTLNIILPDSITQILTNKIATATASIVRTLRVGSVGEDVKALQTALGITADGAFGPKTKAAVVAFQISKGLVGDGVFGPISRLALAGGVPVSKVGCTATTIYSPVTGAKC